MKTLGKRRTPGADAEHESTPRTSLKTRRAECDRHGRSPQDIDDHRPDLDSRGLKRDLGQHDQRVIGPTFRDSDEIQPALVGTLSDAHDDIAPRLKRCEAHADFHPPTPTQQHEPVKRVSDGPAPAASPCGSSAV